MFMYSSRQKMIEAQRIADQAMMRKSDSTRHKCFVSYHVADLQEVEAFLDTFGEEFIPRTIGVTDEDDFIDSDNEDYIKSRIREEYLSNSTVTIVLLGEGTWGRKYVDWEISATLRNDTVNKRSGLLVMPLPSKGNSAHLPARVKDNWVSGDSDNSYALYYSCPSNKATLRRYIEEAFNAPALQKVTWLITPAH
jgi:hypothetical protein